MTSGAEILSGTDAVHAEVMAFADAVGGDVLERMKAHDKEFVPSQQTREWQKQFGEDELVIDGFRRIHKYK